MSPENIEANLESLRVALRSSQGYIEVQDEDYGVVFQFQFVPCCFPLHVLVWLNADSEGVFIRVIFPRVTAEVDSSVMCRKLNSLNYSLPIGAFASNPESGEVRFKSALFVGDSKIDRVILGHLFASTGDMVRTNFHGVMHVVTGVHHSH